jgi:hypothetical protein
MSSFKLFCGINIFSFVKEFSRGGKKYWKKIFFSNIILEKM